MAEIHYNIVTFRPDGAGVRVALELQQPFVFSAGIKPAVVSAVASYAEFAKLPSKPGPFVTGTLEFWYTSAPDAEGGGSPDVSYGRMRIVDVEPHLRGKPPRGRRPFVMQYLLFIADVREQIQPPRGGRVTLGLVNPELGETEDPQGFFQDGKEPEPRDTVPLMVHCLNKMGVAFTPPSAAVDEAGPPPNLKWYGLPAADALQHLLEHASSVLCPRIDGTLQVWKVGEGELPDVPDDRRTWQMNLRGMDRRGTAVIFTSAPNAVLETRWVDLGSGLFNPLQFVIQDQEGNWREINDPKLRSEGMIMQGSGSASGPVATVRGHFSGVKSKFRDQVRRQLYHCIRLNPLKFTPGVQRIVRRLVNLKRKVVDLEVRAAVPTLDPLGRVWTNSKDKGPDAVKCHATFLYGKQNVIQVHELLGKIGRDPEQAPDQEAGPTADFEGLFEELAGQSSDTPAELIVRVTMEAGTDLPKDLRGGPDKVPEYYNVGFGRTSGGGVRQLKPAELAALIDRPTADTVFISRPELRLVREYDRDPEKLPADNADELEDAARALAERFLASDRQPYQVVQLKGFQRIDLNGVVSEVRIDQGIGGSGPMTTYTLNSWWTALGPQTVREIQDSVSPAYPKQGRVLDDSIAMGTAGATQPIVPLLPAPPPPAGIFAVVLVKSGGEQGTKTKPASWIYDVYGSEADIGKNALLKDASPERGRPNGKMSSGTIGLARVVGGQVRLMEAFEQYNTGECP